MYITNYARVGKTILKAITGVQRNSKKIILLENGESETSYYNEANRFHIKTTQRLSKLQIKQFILYHFIDIDRFGVVRNISVEKLANMLNCSTNTIKNNNLRLEELEYITFTDYCSGRFSVLIRDYRTYHLTRREGGSGYLTLRKEIVNSLLSIEDVNVLRLEIRKLIKFDESNIGNYDNQSCGEYSYNDIKLFLPKYIGYRKILEKLNKQTHLFKSKLEEGKIKFQMLYEFTLDKIEEDIVKECDIVYNLYKDKINIDIFAIFNKTIKYGAKRVSMALDTIKSSYVDRKRKIRNIEGLLVSVILGQNR